jgi:hypothetical protein
MFAAMAAVPAAAASPLDGTWKADPLATRFDQRPEFLLLKDGIYECRACTPPLRIPADGQPHATPGRDYADAMSARVLDDRTMQVASYKAGRKYAEFTRTLSSDGNLMTTINRTAPDGAGEWTTRTSQLRRVGPGPAGSFAQSGYWLPVAANGGPELRFQLKVSGRTLSMQDSDGSGYTAVFGGGAVPVVGDRDGAMVSVRLLGPSSFEETNFVRGKMTGVNVYRVRKRTLTIESRNVRSGFTDTYVLRKQ